MLSLLIYCKEKYSPLSFGLYTHTDTYFAFGETITSKKMDAFWKDKLRTIFLSDSLFEFGTFQSIKDPLLVTIKIESAELGAFEGEYELNWFGSPSLHWGYKRDRKVFEGIGVGKGTGSKRIDYFIEVIDENTFVLEVDTGVYYVFEKE
jgi:hypothetical protein